MKKILIGLFLVSVFLVSCSVIDFPEATGKIVDGTYKTKECRNDDVWFFQYINGKEVDSGLVADCKYACVDLADGARCISSCEDFRITNNCSGNDIIAVYSGCGEVVEGPVRKVCAEGTSCQRVPFVDKFGVAGFKPRCNLNSHCEGNTFYNETGAFPCEDFFGLPGACGEIGGVLGCYECDAIYCVYTYDGRSYSFKSYQGQCYGGTEAIQFNC